MNQQEEIEKFIDAIKMNIDYWCSVSVKDRERLEGFAFSMLAMFDGDSASNGFNKYKIINEQGLEINKDVELHSLFKKGNK